MKTKGPAHSGRFSTFFQNYANYIALSPTEEFSLGLREHHFNAVRAHWFGAELEYQYTLPQKFLHGLWDLEFRTDWVRGLDLTRNGNLPRVTPVRATVGVNYQHRLFRADFEFQRVEGQGFTATNERATPGFNLLNFGLEAPVTTGFGTFKAIFRASNLLNVEARNHVSFLKEIAPLPGRNLSIGIQAAI